VESIFQQPPGQLFVVRVAGNVVGRTQLGSLEFAVEELGVQLILVLGHSQCGAVGAALASTQGHAPVELSENLQPILGRIARALEPGAGEARSGEPISPERAWRLNVMEAVQDLTAHSPLLEAAVKGGNLRIVGGLYDLKTGGVEFYD
jgi:carbonic anhydrase